MSDSVRIRSSQGMLEATQRAVLCIMISKGEPSFWVPTNVFLTSNLPLLFNHLDLGWTGLVSMGAMFFLPFLGTGSTGTPMGRFVLPRPCHNTFNKNLPSFIGNPSRGKKSLSHFHTNSIIPKLSVRYFFKSILDGNNLCFGSH